MKRRKTVTRPALAVILDAEEANFSAFSRRCEARLCGAGYAAFAFDSFISAEESVEINADALIILRLNGTEGVAFSGGTTLSGGAVTRFRYGEERAADEAYEAMRAACSALSGRNLALSAEKRGGEIVLRIMYFDPADLERAAMRAGAAAAGDFASAETAICYPPTEQDVGLLSEFFALRTAEGSAALNIKPYHAGENVRAIVMETDEEGAEKVIRAILEED